MIPFFVPGGRVARTWARRSVLALGGGLALLASAASSAAPTAQPIRIGLIEGLSGPFGNAGEAVARNLQWAVERVNARGGVRLPEGSRPLALLRLDSKGSVEEALSVLKSALDQDVAFVAQGNSSAVAAALIEALNKHNQREPARRALLLNYSAVEPSLTNEKCSPWHFRFDAHADMRLSALLDVLAQDRALSRVYLIGQDYSFGQHVVRRSQELIGQRRPDIAVVGQELHPIGRVKDFLPYAAKIKASGAQAVVTGNWGNDLTLLVKAARDVGFEGKFYTFYGNALGVPGALGEAGVGRVVALAEWHPNVGGRASDELVQRFRQRFPKPEDDYLHLRMQVMVEMLAQAIERARRTEAGAVARALSGARYDGRSLGGLGQGVMRAGDQQFIQPLYVSVMQKAGSEGVRFDVEGSGYGFRTLRYLSAAQTELPHSCRMPAY
ncbi:MAG: branched-chain amino acid ABC transporter substrate-binding protein [Burkholderiaceae bacterium]|nr:branched-chain amino acid ABC transporter substrate-binding protein [Burkholderiaceae bacterium]